MGQDLDSYSEFWLEKLKRIDHLRGLDVELRILLEWYLDKYVVEVLIDYRD
jgi:hypothetical protein